MVKKAIEGMVPPKTGKYLFLLGMAVAIVAGIIGATTIGLGNFAGWISLVLVVLGILVGFLNVQPHERQAFLIAAIALSMLGLTTFAPLVISSVNIGGYITNVMDYLVVFVAPAAAIAALYEIYDLAQG